MSKSTKTEMDTGPKILLLDGDPYLAFLLQLQVPRATLLDDPREVDADSLLADHPDVVIVNVADKRAREIVGRKGKARIIGVGEMSAESLIAPEGLDAVLQKPLVPAELHRALVKTLAVSPAELPMSAAATRFHRWFVLARVTAIGLAALLELGAGSGEFRGLILFAAGLFVTIRLAGKRITPAGAAVDVGAATILLLLTGGSGSGYVFFGLVAAAEAGLVLQTKIAIMAGSLLAMGSFVEVYRSAVAGQVPPRELIAWLVVFPLTAVASSMAARVWQSGGQGEKLLAEANRLLSSLHRIAKTVPGQLDTRGAAVAAAQRLQESIGSPSGSIWLAEAGMFASIFAFGTASSTDVVLEQDDEFIRRLMDSEVLELRPEDIPAQLREVFAGEPLWFGAPMIHSGVADGFIITAADASSGRHDSAKIVLQQIARETAVAIDNARLFRRVREMSVDEERKRLARELHDGISQALTHIRLELEFLARHGPSSPEAGAEEAARLSKVVSRAASEVRAMINGLTSTVARDGLAVSLGSYLRDLNELVSQNIEFTCTATGSFPPEVENEVFRIAQEATSSALRYSKGESISVTLASDGLRLTLSVADDGVYPGRDNRERDLAVATMQERAKLVGGRLETRSSEEGTVVEIVIDPGEAWEENEMRIKSA